jgi:hypothetical protein
MTNAKSTTVPTGGPAGSLERRVQRLAAAVAVLAVGLALSLLWHFLPHPESNASRFILRDAAGTWRGGLEMSPDGNPTLRLNDARGRAMLYGLVQSDGTPRFRLSDSTGTSRIVLEVYPDGSPHAMLLGTNGRTGIHAWLGAGGQPSLDVRYGPASRHFDLRDSTAAPNARSPRDGASRGQ